MKLSAGNVPAALIFEVLFSQDFRERVGCKGRETVNEALFGSDFLFSWIFPPPTPVRQM